MKQNPLHLDFIINTNNFENIQDSISAATDMAMLTVDFRGIPVTKHCRCSELCKKIRSHPEFSSVCQKCDSRGGLEAARLGQPYIYLCHMGIVDFAVPIIVNGQYLGAVMAGQVLLDTDNDKDLLEQIVGEKSAVIASFNKTQLQGLYNKLPVMKLDKIKAIAGMIYNLSNYIVEEAILKINLNEKQEIVLQNEYIRNNSFTLESNGGSKDNILLRPALEYIENNYSRQITLDGMAAICNISSSYFSKLFKRDIGENFANYINKIRIRKAKELLETSNDSITNISMDLGFEECGYFIKVFKRLEGVTPAVYRNDFNKYRKF